MSSLLQAACHVQIVNQEFAAATNSNFADRPTTGWSKISEFPHQPQPSSTRLAEAYWYKIDWLNQCDSQQSTPISIFISHINMAGQVYLNHDLLWKDESLIEPLSRSWNTPRQWTLPNNLLSQQRNTLWIYVQGTVTQPAHLGKVIIGDSSTIESIYQDFYFEQRGLLYLSLIINGIIGLFYLMAWVINRQDTGFLYIGITLFCWVIYNILFISQSSLFDSIIFERIIIWVFSSYTCIKCIGLWRFAKLHFPKIENIISILWLVMTAIIWLMPVDYLTITLSILLLINLILFISYNISYPFLIYKTKHTELYVLAVIQALTVPVALHDAYYFLIQQPSFWSPYYAPVSALFIGMVLALKLHRHNQQIASFNADLKQQVSTAILEREQALTMQHQLELQNTRLQERMHLAHDLHDSLGSSLVRSMAIVDQSKSNLTNQQFSSMLKVLRDDLRQIIDSGSSFGDAPKTPKIWGAAVRYRFLQIFDELEIDLEWNVPESWQTQPTALECLTYLRVIEEALTNVLKHSQATKVLVHLSYDDKGSLILQIKDNGKGFNAESVFQSGMSIGLKSMQARVQKIGASLAVTSNAEGTRIEVIRKEMLQSEKNRIL